MESCAWRFWLKDVQTTSAQSKEPEARLLSASGHTLTCASVRSMLSSVLQTVCQSLSHSEQVVRSAALFALGQFAEHLQVGLNTKRPSRGLSVKIQLGPLCLFVCPQPEVNKYCGELMPLLLGYLSSLNEAKVGHLTKAFYALENFLENLGRFSGF